MKSVFRRSPTMRFPWSALLLVLLLAPPSCRGFVPPRPIPAGPHVLHARQQQIELVTKLDPERVTNLFAWVSRAFAGDDAYNNLMGAVCASFSVDGSLPEESSIMSMLAEARKRLPEDAETTPGGARISRFDREQASLGAMGAAQWTGNFRTRPHALLDVRELSYDEWFRSLPRGCRRTLKKVDPTATGQPLPFTVVERPIISGEAAPHSTLGHFRCVVEHEVRLLAGRDTEYRDAQDFLNGLSDGVSRYVGTTRMAGTIREYRDAETGKVIAFAHEATKGRTVRGQWFYSTDEASKQYVWFHSVADLVRRAALDDGVDTVDLGPSGSDAFSELKARYGFESVVDWPAQADYMGPFVYGENHEENDFFGKAKTALYEKMISNNGQG
mmetsp:Transcript_13713/g.27380  ORF Transcript_13713/g.27380 Transcript_13713/m.27380 type:complete len:386 (+) Transcript_13713:46-1203(+)